MRIESQKTYRLKRLTCAAAFAAVNRIDDFAYMPQQNIAHAMTALMASMILESSPPEAT